MHQKQAKLSIVKINLGASSTSAAKKWLLTVLIVCPWVSLGGKRTGCGCPHLIDLLFGLIGAHLLLFFVFDRRRRDGESAWSSSSSSFHATDPLIEEIIKNHVYGSGGCEKNFLKACYHESGPRDAEACAKARNGGDAQVHAGQHRHVRAACAIQAKLILRALGGAHLPYIVSSLNYPFTSPFTTTREP
jgi:hypothetical protein